MPTDRTNTERQRTFRQRQREARAGALVTGAPAAPAIPTMPGTARWKALHEQAKTAIQTMRDEMQAYYDDRSEHWQDGSKGDEFQAMMEAADELVNELEGYNVG